MIMGIYGPIDQRQCVKDSVFFFGQFLTAPLLLRCLQGDLLGLGLHLDLFALMDNMRTRSAAFGQHPEHRVACGSDDRDAPQSHEAILGFYHVAEHCLSSVIFRLIYHNGNIPHSQTPCPCYYATHLFAVIVPPLARSIPAVFSPPPVKE